jgi:hypothetical protein
MITSFAELLRPHDPALLLAAAAKGERLLLRTDQADSFARLLPWERLNELITPDKVLAGDIEFGRNNTILPAEMTIIRPRRQKPPTRMRLPALEQYTRQGVSAVINGVDRVEPALGRLSAIIEREFRSYVQINVYASFGRDSAFKPHCDTHNVLVLHLQGRKHWRCWGRPWQAPLSQSTCKVSENMGPAEWDVVLEPGDVLYLPRGEIHGASLLEGEDSLHLTIGIEPPRIEALTAALAQICQEEALGRQDLPILADAAARAAWLEAAKALLHQAVDRLDLDEVLTKLDQREEALPGGFFGVSHRLTSGTMISPTIRRRVPLIADEATGFTMVKAGSQSWTIDALERKILAEALRHHVVTLETLLGALADEAEASICEAVRALAAKGLVTLRTGCHEQKGRGHP